MKPILFNTEMVRAILEGRKTVTRRVVKFQLGRNPKWTGYVVDGLTLYNGRNEPCNVPAPYKVNDILYVRESYMPAGCRMCEAYECYGSCGCPDYLYKADFGENDLAEFKEDGYNWKPSIHMPKEAARIFLRVISVRMERLLAITEEQAWKEGIVSECARCKNYDSLECQECANIYEALDNFMDLWDSTIKKDQLNTYGWEADPYVWVIEFERVEKPAAD